MVPGAEEMMAELSIVNKTSACGYLWLSMAFSCFGQSQEALCPRHIEPPAYPPLAKAANITAKVVLTLTVDATGKVTAVKVANEDEKWVGFLKAAAADNVRLWTFAKPPLAPYIQTVVYDFELDPSLPGDDGYHPIVKVAFDLPDRVTISANARLVDHNGSEGTTPIKKKHWWQ